MMDHKGSIATEALNKKFNSTQAWRLALFGYLPFAILTIAIWIQPVEWIAHEFLINALKTYAAVILSFLGGVRWGAAIAGTKPGDVKFELFLSVLPSLAGWFSLYLEVPLVFAVLALAFASQGVWDVYSENSGKLPPWYVRLRIGLTFLVCGTLIAAFLITL